MCTVLRKINIFILLLLVSTSVLASGTSNKWRIEVSEGAKSNGLIIFRLTPEESSSLDVTVHINDGLRENKVAKAIKQAFQEQLPAGNYHIERDDGEDVLVKKRRKTKNFKLELISNSVKAVRINLGKE